MASENLRSKHAFGSSENLENAISAGKIDAYDILFLDADTKPKIGWVDKNGEVVIVTDEKADLTELESDVEALESEVSKKANAEQVDAKFDEINSDVAELVSDVDACENTHEKIKYEITSVPVGTLIDYRDSEIRIMCPKDSVFTKQAVGENGDANTYYMTFRTYAPNNAVGYIEHIGNQSDKEVLTDLSTDKYGRKYQSTWLGLAAYNESADTWTYYGKNSSFEKYIGWDYQIDWYDENGVMIASDSIRINLSNEECHSSIEPYYVSGMNAEVDSKIEQSVTESKLYTDEQLAAAIAEAMQVIEF